jgi:hypothetical protein
MNAATATPSTVTVDLPVPVALELLVAAGWGICLHEGHRSYTRPTGRPRGEGGKCGPDYLWALDEALTAALAG